MLSMIQPAVIMDNMQVFDHQMTYQDFLRSFTLPIIHYNTVTQQNVTVNPYGISQFVNTRFTTALQQLGVN